MRKHLQRWGVAYLLAAQAIALLALKHHIFKAEAWDMERLEGKVDDILANLADRE